MIHFTRATAFTLCLSQVAITGGVIMFFPPVRVQIFTSHPKVDNGTLVENQSQLSVTEFGLSLPFLILSCVAVLFSTTTAGLTESGMLQQDNHYTFELLSEAAQWDTVFWVFCAGVHVLVVTVITSPVDLYAVLVSSLLLFYFLGRLCSPRCQQLNMTYENMNLLGFCAGVLVAGYNIPDSHTGRAAALVMMVMLDYTLGVGHTWDTVPTMDTVTNCRLFWVCAVSLSLAGLYGAWHECLLK